ncbi:hypothetical protein ACH4VX_07215 [Streptomyces sp. NPDC020731]|uniref:hypothetical protein n=1 Tax=Streptomyces sp. NPDC020731 TaxID=3365085 RepID=UPI0037A63C8B
MSLAETGTRGLLGAAFRPKRHGENYYARHLLHLLGDGFLVLAYRGFDDRKFLGEVADTGAQFLVRLSSTRRLPTEDRLPDGSYLTRVRHVAVRVIDAEITANCVGGSTDPDRASFTVALEAARGQLIIAPTTLNEDALVGRIGHAVLTQLLPARRIRISARRVRCPLFRYGYANPEEGRPLSSRRVGSLAIAIHSIRPTTRALVSRRPSSHVGTRPRLLSHLRNQANRPWLIAPAPSYAPSPAVAGDLANSPWPSTRTMCTVLRYCRPAGPGTG